MKKTAAAIIVAAGSGTRFGSSVPKQFLNLNGTAVYVWAIQAFQKVAEVKQIVVVAPRAHLARVQRDARKYGFMVVAGGKERLDSVRAGLDALDASVTVVAVHDGARPLITPRIITEAFAEARRAGAAVVAMPATDTVKSVSPAGRITSTIPRKTIYLAQTPQVFNTDLLQRALTRPPKNITDDAQAVERLGIRPVIVPGDPRNIKITAPHDLRVAESYLKG